MPDLAEGRGVAAGKDLPARRRRRAARLLIGLGFVLSGSAGASEPGEAAAIEACVGTAGRVDPATPTPRADWWQRFDDPLLEQLVAQALQANTRIAGAQAAVRQAQALRDAAAAALWPTLGASGSAQRGSAGGNSTGNSYRTGLDADWRPDVFGGQRSALAASTADAQARVANLADAQLLVATELALNYITLRSAQARLAIASDNLASQLETLQISRWREQAGLVTSLDVEQARSAAESTRAQLPAFQASIEQTRHALAVLVGQPPAALTALLAPVRPVPQSAETRVLDLPDDTLGQRADVRAAERQVAAALARIGQAEAARLPGFSLAGSLGVAGLTLGSMTGAASVVSTLLAGVSLTLFDGGAAAAEVEAQRAVFDQARENWRATALAAMQEVEDALAALRGDRQRLDSLRQAADAAGLAAVLARHRYNSGLVDFQTVLQTQRTQLAAQDGVASAGADLSANQVRLIKALGGGWRSGAVDGPPTAASAADTALTGPVYRMPAP